MERTNRRLLLVTFHAVTDKFIMRPDELGEAVRKYNKYGIESVKEFDHVKEKFVRLSKDSLKRLIDCDTDSIIEVTKTGFLK